MHTKNVPSWPKKMLPLLAPNASTIALVAVLISAKNSANAFVGLMILCSHITSVSARTLDVLPVMLISMRCSKNKRLKEKPRKILFRDTMMQTIVQPECGVSKMKLRTGV